MFEDDLNRAIALQKSGKKIEAREILKQIVRDDPKNVLAWMWLAYTYTNNFNRIAVLEECLKYNPNNQTVQNWLATFKSGEVKDITLRQELPDFQSNQGEQIRGIDEKISQSANLSRENSPKQHSRKKSLYIILASILGLVILSSVCIFGVWILQKQGMFTIPLVGNPLSSPTSTISPTMSSSSTPINSATITASPTSTIRPTITYSPTQLVTETSLPTYTLFLQPIFDSSPKTIEGAEILVDGKSFSFPVITIYSVQASDKIGNKNAKAGDIYAIVNTRITNPDPGNIATYSSNNFLAIGEDGIMIYPTIAELDCVMDDIVKVMGGESVNTCLIFEVQPQSTFTVMFAPYQNSQLAPGRSLSWEIIFK